MRGFTHIYEGEGVKLTDWDPLAADELTKTLVFKPKVRPYIALDLVACHLSRIPLTLGSDSSSALAASYDGYL